jgi:mRNA interferase MazF
VIVQADVLTEAGLPSVVICLISSHLVNAEALRIPLDPAPENGLRQASPIMVDKVVTVPRARIGAVIGRLDDATLLHLNRTLAFVVGLG